MEGAAGFEGADALEIFALEVQSEGGFRVGSWGWGGEEVGEFWGVGGGVAREGGEG